VLGINLVVEGDADLRGPVVNDLEPVDVGPEEDLPHRTDDSLLAKRANGAKKRDGDVEGKARTVRRSRELR
jgi:hypothetical protein